MYSSAWLRCPADRTVERAYHDDATRDGIRRYVRGDVVSFHCYSDGSTFDPAEAELPRELTRARGACTR
ncbi:MAG: hypothetical protein AAF800_11195 [Planctomycetota bacterium]